jgi:hypothetical protein
MKTNTTTNGARTHNDERVEEPPGYRLHRGLIVDAIGVDDPPVAEGTEVGWEVLQLALDRFHIGRTFQGIAFAGAYDGSGGLVIGFGQFTADLALTYLHLHGRLPDTGALQAVVRRLKTLAGKDLPEPEPVWRTPWWAQPVEPLPRRRRLRSRR